MESSSRFCNGACHRRIDRERVGNLINAELLINGDGNGINQFAGLWSHDNSANNNAGTWATKKFDKSVGNT